MEINHATGATLQTDIDQILDPGTAIPPSDRLDFLLKPIDSSEIKQAVKKCKRGKAHGPDELGNDWASNPDYDRCVIGCTTAGHERSMSRAIALLLDFAKAYDSLDRSFLAQALQHLGFPLKFFIVNGFLSRKYNVTSGIRQGCPLAPLLFILALEVLYRKIEASDEIHGVELQAAGCATEVRLGGYADDTTIYLSDPKDINAVFAILDKYGAASGLRVNRHKSAVLPLNKEYSSTEESVSDIHVLQREEHCRYLGIQVGQTPSNASNWSKCIQPYVSDFDLRVSKLTLSPNAQQLPLHDLVKQFVWGSRNGKPAKPWMKEEQAELKKMNGGLSVPNIRTELMTMSATAVSKWAITTSHIDQVIGETLLHNTRASSTYITPLDAIPRRPPQLRDNMWTTGAALCASLHSRPYEPRERDNVRWCYEHFKSTIVQTQWDGDVFQIDLSSKMSDRLPGIIAEGRKLRGTFCAEWLPYMTSTADGWLLDPNGSPYKLAHTSLPVGTAQLGDILRWEWIRPGVLNFIPTCGIFGFSRPSIRALERLCATLVSNFPQLLYRPQQTNVLRLYNGQRHYNHEWHLHTSEATLTHVDTTLVKATHTVHSATDCDVMATRDLNGQKVSFHAHPRFTRIVQLWGGNGRYNTTRSFYRQQVAATRTQIGKDTRDAAVNKAVQTAGSLWPGLQLIQWSELHNIPGITVYTAQTLLRLKANRLSMWNYEKADLSCSNPECSQVVQSSVQHLFWECPKAKLVWNYFYALWTKIGITPGHDPAIWIFSLDLPDTPRHAWTTIKRHIIGHKFSNEHLQDHLYSVAHMLWRYMSASLIHAIWCAHLRRMDSDPIESTAEMAIMMTRLEAGMRNLTRLAEAQAGDSDGHTVAAVLKAYVDCFLSQTDAIPLTPSDTRGVYLLFFDGGSRGNPGPGGTGSIIVRVHKDSHTASLIWAASMAYSRKDTTNNFAEYWGLIHGLREAQRSHFEPLYVIGDSALIISQQRMHRSPRQHRLARLYQTSRRLADCIDIRGWYHHYRAFNKMADSAANLAMDTRTSTQVHFPTQRAAFNNLTQDLDNDVMHWLMRSSEDPSMAVSSSSSPHTDENGATTTSSLGVPEQILVLLELSRVAIADQLVHVLKSFRGAQQQQLLLLLQALAAEGHLDHVIAHFDRKLDVKDEILKRTRVSHTAECARARAHALSFPRSGHAARVPQVCAPPEQVHTLDGAVSRARQAQADAVPVRNVSRPRPRRRALRTKAARSTLATALERVGACATGTRRQLSHWWCSKRQRRILQCHPRLPRIEAKNRRRGNSKEQRHIVPRTAPTADLPGEDASRGNDDEEDNPPTLFLRSSRPVTHAALSLEQYLRRARSQEILASNWDVRMSSSPEKLSTRLLTVPAFDDFAANDVDALAPRTPSHDTGRKKEDIDELHVPLRCDLDVVLGNTAATANSNAFALTETVSLPSIASLHNSRRRYSHEVPVPNMLQCEQTPSSNATAEARHATDDSSPRGVPEKAKQQSSTTTTTQLPPLVIHPQTSTNPNQSAEDGVRHLSSRRLPSPTDFNSSSTATTSSLNRSESAPTTLTSSSYTIPDSDKPKRYRGLAPALETFSSDFHAVRDRGASIFKKECAKIEANGPSRIRIAKSIGAQSHIMAVRVQHALGKKHLAATSLLSPLLSPD
ncbi:reverse transcriptase, partial [Globisporangium splendens]